MKKRGKSKNADVESLKVLKKDILGRVDVAPDRFATGRANTSKDGSALDVVIHCPTKRACACGVVLAHDDKLGAGYAALVRKAPSESIMGPREHGPCRLAAKHAGVSAHHVRGVERREHNDIIVA